MTFVYTLKDVIGLIALGVGVVGFLLIIIFARILDKVSNRRKKREERIEKKLQEKYDKEEPKKQGVNKCIT